MYWLRQTITGQCNKMMHLVMGACLLSPLAGFAGELHQHIEVRVVDQRVQATFCRPEKGCSLVKPETLGLPAGQMPIDKLTDTPIYVSEFSIFPDRTAIDSPGFEGIEGELTPGDRVRYQAIGHLSYWSLEERQWTLAPEGTQVLGQRQLSPKTVAAFSELTRRFLKQTSIDGEALVRRDLAAALALTIDKAGFYG